MVPVLFQELLDEQALEFDDIRWYRAEQLAEEFITLSNHRMDLTRRIWSGEVERRVRSLGEDFVTEIQEQFERGLLDESDLHRLVAEIGAAKMRRNRAGEGS